MNQDLFIIIREDLQLFEKEIINERVLILTNTGTTAIRWCPKVPYFQFLTFTNAKSFIFLFQCRTDGAGALYLRSVVNHNQYTLKAEGLVNDEGSAASPFQLHSTILIHNGT